MSHVTDVVLLQSAYLGDWEKARLPLINRFFDPDGINGLVSVDDESLLSTSEDGRKIKWYGGGKALQCNIAIGAFNNLDIDAFLLFLRGEIPWGCDDGTCQLLIKDEHDIRFSMHEIYSADW